MISPPLPGQLPRELHQSASSHRGPRKTEVASFGPALLNNPYTARRRKSVEGVPKEERDASEGSDLLHPRRAAAQARQLKFTRWRGVHGGTETNWPNALISMTYPRLMWNVRAVQ